MEHDEDIQIPKDWEQQKIRLSAEGATFYAKELDIENMKLMTVEIENVLVRYGLRIPGAEVNRAEPEKYDGYLIYLNRLVLRRGKDGCFCELVLGKASRSQRVRLESLIQTSLK